MPFNRVKRALELDKKNASLPKRTATTMGSKLENKSLENVKMIEQEMSLKSTSSMD